MRVRWAHVCCRAKCSEQEAALRSKELLLLAANDKLVQCEQRLYPAQRQLHTSQAQCVRLSVQLQQLRDQQPPGKRRSSSAALASH